MQAARAGAATRRAAATSAPARVQFDPSCLDLGVERPGPQLLPLGLRQPVTGVASEGQDVVQGVAVLPLELVEQLPPDPDLLEPLGIVLPGLDDRAQLGGQVREFGHPGPYPVRQSDQGNAAVEVSGRLGQPVEGARPLASRYRSQCRRRGLSVGGRLGQAILLGFEPLLLAAAFDAGPLDLADLVAE